MPLGDLEEEGWYKILIIAAQWSFVEQLYRLLSNDNIFKCELAESGFSAGAQTYVFRPDLMIIDLSLGREQVLKTVQSVRRAAAHKNNYLIALAVEDDPHPEALQEAGFNEAFKKPVDAMLLAKRIRTLAKAKLSNDQV